MANYVYIATSLDGFIATSEGDLDWLDGIPHIEKSDYAFAEFIEGIDALVMGRKTYEKVLTFGKWPYNKPVFVLSRGKVEVPKKLEGKVDCVGGDMKTVVNQLNKLGHQNLYIDGGITIQNFLEEDLIDEMIITRVPILLGEGIPLFGKLTKRLHFKHKKTEVHHNILVISHYERRE